MMTDDEILEKIKYLKSKRDYILESRKNAIVDSANLKEFGYVWSLRLDTKYEYHLDLLIEIKVMTGAHSVFIEYTRGLWLKLYFYFEQRPERTSFVSHIREDFS